MSDADRREASLDLTPDELGALIAGVTDFAEHEVAATRVGRVFERAPSAAEVGRVVGTDRGLRELTR